MAKQQQVSSSQPLDFSNWWFSADHKRGFSWGDVVGYDFKKSGSIGNSISTLYLYLHSGIYHLEGQDAEQVAAKLMEDGK